MWRLQKGDDPECRAFRKLVRGHDRVLGGTMQGIYIFAPDGRLLARQNTNRAADVKTLMLGALKKWKELPAAENPVGDIKVRNRWERNRPAEGLILRRTARDLPVDQKPNSVPAKRFNPDAVWFSAEEAPRWIPESLRLGQRSTLPSDLSRRISRLVFVDNARGQTIPFAPSEVIESRFESKIVSVDESEVRIAIRGKSLARAKGPWLLGQNDWKPAREWPHSIETTIRGSATWNRIQSRFTAFEILALGQRRGKTVMCGRRDNVAPGPIGYVLRLAPENWRVAPTFIDMYDVNWVRHPNSPRASSEPNFATYCWVKTLAKGKDFPILRADKDWEGGDIKNYSSHNNFGVSRTTGSARGFAFFIQPNGAWGWSLGDGKRRLDYLPTAAAQPINDGKLHFLGCSIDRRKDECRLYYDGNCVAIYSLTGMGALRESKAIIRDGEGLVYGGTWSRPYRDAEVKKWWKTKSKTSVVDRRSLTRVKTLKVLAWNIWHGGRRDGDELGLKKTVEAIKASGADIVCMQETYGSGAAIADALGFQLYLRSSNLSVMSRYPIVESHDLYQPFRFGGVTLELSPGQLIKAFSLWIHSHPDVGEAMAQETISVEELLLAESKTRAKEIKQILATLEPHVRGADEIPLIVAGDFNSASHLDWTKATASKHRDLVVSWPVSMSMAKYGFRDAFRWVHPNPLKTPARTWSPRFKDSYRLRIDYVYLKGKALSAKSARMIDEHPGGWPSDHAAVLTTIELDD